MGSPPNPPRGGAHATPAARRVLIAEPDGDAAFILAAWLERRGYRVALATTAEAARRAAETPVDVAFVSQQLPDMSGNELAQRLRAAQPKALDLRIIATASDPQDADEAFDALLLVPPTAQALREVLGDG